MIIDGKDFSYRLQEKLKKQIVASGAELSLGVLIFKEDSATKQFTGVKKETGKILGVGVALIPCSEGSTTEEAVLLVEKYAREHDGIIVQLPLPSHIDTDSVLGAIPKDKDVDGIGEQVELQEVLPPVVAAMREITNENGIEIQDKKILIVGRGRLVGAPAISWFRKQGADVKVANRKTEDLESLTKEADIIVLGTGRPGILTENMVKDDVVILDAGSGEVGGVVKGDADVSIANKASIFTPTPRGIGPIAVTMIFANLLTLWQKKQKERKKQ